MIPPLFVRSQVIWVKKKCISFFEQLVKTSFILQRGCFGTDCMLKIKIIIVLSLVGNSRVQQEWMLYETYKWLGECCCQLFAPGQYFFLLLLILLFDWLVGLISVVSIWLVCTALWQLRSCQKYFMFCKLLWLAIFMTLCLHVDSTKDWLKCMHGRLLQDDNSNC